jgi:hypothetical protein
MGRQSRGGRAGAEDVLGRPKSGHEVTEGGEEAAPRLARCQAHPPVAAPRPQVAGSARATYTGGHGSGRGATVGEDLGEAREGRRG